MTGTVNPPPGSFLPRLPRSRFDRTPNDFSGVTAAGTTDTRSLEEWMAALLLGGYGILGAVGDGVADDTAAFQAVFDAGRQHIIIPPGTYLVDPLTIPSTVKSFIGIGRPKFIPKSGAFTATDWQGEWNSGTTYAVGDSVALISTGLVYRCIAASTNDNPSSSPAYWTAVSFASFLTFSSGAGLQIGGFDVEVDGTVYPHVRSINLSACTDTRIDGVRCNGAGFIGFYGANCIGLDVVNCRVKDFQMRGFSFEGASQARITVDRVSAIKGTGTALYNALSAQLGSDIAFLNSYVEGAGVFAFRMATVTRARIEGNTSIDSYREGANFNDCSGRIAGNRLEWTDGSDDFGISVSASSTACPEVLVVGNTVIGCGKDGIVLTTAGSATLENARVSDNTVKDCNDSDESNGAGILLAGTGTKYANVCDNTIIDTRGSPLHYYGIAEINKGQGLPTYNRVYDNHIRGFATAATLLGGTTSIRTDNSDDVDSWRTTTPTPTAQTGTITTVSCTIKYRIVGKFCHFILSSTITDAGTGAGTLVVAAPITPAATGSGSGNCPQIGKAIRIDISTTGNMLIRFADNTTVITTGNVLTVVGFYEIS